MEDNSFTIIMLVSPVQQCKSAICMCVSVHIHPFALKPPSPPFLNVMESRLTLTKHFFITSLWSLVTVMSLDTANVTAFSHENTKVQASCPPFRGFVPRTSNGTAVRTHLWGRGMLEEACCASPAPPSSEDTFRKPPPRLCETRLIKQDKQKLIKCPKTNVWKRCLAS